VAFTALQHELARGSQTAFRLAGDSQPRMKVGTTVVHSRYCFQPSSSTIATQGQGMFKTEGPAQFIARKLAGDKFNIYLLVFPVKFSNL